jgi:hypothetical protein
VSIPEVWGTTNVLEALRLVLALLLILAAGVGFVRATDGRLAFSWAIRARMLRRRRVQMAVFLSIAIMWGLQTTLAANTPDAPVLSLPAIGVSLCTIYTLLSLGLLALHQFRGWSAFQEIVTRPLQPSQLEEATAAGRDLGHLASNELTIVLGVLEIVAQEPGLSPTRRADLDQAITSVAAAAAQIQALHAQIRHLDPTWKAPVPHQEPTV